jgi:hypothetical protein
MVPKIGGTAGGGTPTTIAMQPIFRLHYVTATVRTHNQTTRDMHGMIWERSRGRPTFKEVGKTSTIGGVREAKRQRPTTSTPH